MRFRGRPQYFVQQQPIAQPALAPQAPDQPGYLLIQVSTAQGAIPIPGASIVISIGDDLIYNLSTDAEGKSITMTIMAPSSELSQQRAPIQYATQPSTFQDTIQIYIKTCRYSPV